jgi:hypothetical protein
MLAIDTRSNLRSATKRLATDGFPVAHGKTRQQKNEVFSICLQDEFNQPEPKLMSMLVLDFRLSTAGH